MADFDATVIGAGAVGLSCAAALAAAGQSVLVIEAEAGPGEGTSSRNSEVVHAGFYYPRGSLKHLLCIRGRRLLYPFLAAHGIAHRRCGKLVVATNAAEVAAVERLAARAAENDIEGVSLLSRGAARALEPEVRCTAALFSTETGIFDSHGYVMALEAEIATMDGLIAYRSPFAQAEPVASGFRVKTGGDDPAEFITTRLVNSAGLSAPGVAARIADLPASAVPQARLAKGNYFGLSGQAPFSRLVYPAPVDGGLGVHATLDLAGRVRFGPDVEWLHVGLEGPDYAVDLRRADSFYAAVRRYWPALPDGALFADYAGVRPKLSGPGEPAADFRIDGPESHGLGGLVNLFGIESPGLTASLAIAEDVLARLS